MGSLPARKHRPSPSVEWLEDRRLLSLGHPGPPSGWADVGSARAVEPQAWTASPIEGAADSPGADDQADGGPTSPSPSGPACPTPNPMASSPSGRAAGDSWGSSPFVRAEGGPWPQGGPWSNRPSPTQTADAHPFATGWAVGTPAGGGTVSASGASSAPKAPAPEGSPAPDPRGDARNSPPGALVVAASSNPPARGGSPVLSPRSSEVASTSRDEPVAPGPIGVPFNSELSPSSTTAPSTTPEVATGATGHGPSTPNILAGQGPLETEGRATLELDGPKAAFDAASPSAPIGALPVAAEPAGGGLGGLDAPDPQLADVITSLAPFGLASLEEAIDRFLEPIDGLASSMTAMNRPMGLVSASLAIAVTVATVEVAVRLRRSRDEESQGGIDAEPGRFPGLPGLGRWPRS